MGVVMVVVGVTEEEEEEISRERGDPGVCAGVQNATKCAEGLSFLNHEHTVFLEAARG